MSRNSLLKGNLASARDANTLISAGNLERCTYLSSSLIKNRREIATLSNPPESIGLGDEIQSLSKRRMSRFARASASPAQTGLHFREGLFNGREIRRIGRQEQETTSSGFDSLPHLRPQVDREGIQDHDLPWPQAGSEHLLDRGRKSSTIGGAIQDEGWSHRRRETRRRSGS